MKNLICILIIALLFPACGEKEQSGKRNAEPAGSTAVRESEESSNQAGELDRAFLEAADDDDLDKVRELLAGGVDVNTRHRNGWSALHMAANDGSAEVAKLLISKGADLEAKDSWGKTPLLCAASHQSTELMKLLLASGADLEVVDNWGSSALHVAVVPWSEMATIKLILAEGLHPDTRNSYGSTPLHRTVQFDCLKVAEFLIASGADVNAIDSGGSTPLDDAVNRGGDEMIALLRKHGAEMRKYSANISIAAKFGEVARIKELLAAGANVNAEDIEGRTGVHNASIRGHTEVVRLLLANKADPDARINASTTLIDAAVAGHAEIVEMLVKHGAELEAIGFTGHYLTPTALNGAAAEGHKRVVEILISAGANTEAKNSNLLTPLHQAVQHGHLAVTELLLAKGANVHSRTGDHDSALDLAKSKEMKALLRSHNAISAQALKTAYLEAAKTGDLTKVKELLQKDEVSLYASDQQRRTALHLAAENKRIELVKFLLTRGRWDKIRTRELRTSLHSAVQGGSAEVVRLLIAGGADINATALYGELLDRKWLTPLHLAVRQNNREIAELLIASGADVNVQASNDGPPLDYAETWEMKNLLRKHGAKTGKELQEKDR